MIAFLFAAFQTMGQQKLHYGITNLFTDESILSLNAIGEIFEWKDLRSKQDHLAKDTAAPLITLVSGGKHYSPDSLLYDLENSILHLKYNATHTSIQVKVSPHSTHLTLEIIKAEPSNKIEAIIWGPIPSTIKDTVGEVIGVVRNNKVALGLQVLNIKTLGGNYQNNEGSYWGRGLAAYTTAWGSVMQAYTINRDRDRIIDGWNGQYKNMRVKRIKGETVVGSKIALFLCAADKTLDRLEQIELAEGLPHPMVNGKWFKRSDLFGRSYLISSFNENEVDEMIGYTKRAGLISLYHEGPFKSWGHFILDSAQFPNGRAGLKQCVEKAHKAGIFLGIHVLSNFINTNDPYVTPVPDPRLMSTGAATIKAINADQTTISVSSGFYFKKQASNHLRTIRIGTELIQYDSATQEPPYILLGCKRGAFGTKASSHPAGEKAFKLIDHDYGVFFPDIDMQKEVAINFANLLNETGVDHFDFDGFEGGVGTGEGDYGVEIFSKEIYDRVKHPVIYGTSISKSYFWHIGSYYNWGEPWYGGFKESMQQYRIDNQGLFDRNFMPHMLGWYLLTEKTTLAEMEWMLARSAAYNAGFAMVARPNALRKNPISGQLLDAIREWEAARNSGFFTKEQKEAMKDTGRNFHLERVQETWKLVEF